MRALAMTPEALAVKMQEAGRPISGNSIRCWMAGARVPAVRRIEEVAEHLGCTAADLLAEEKAAV